MATSYLTPGVYVEETPPGSRPIEGVGTSVAAFVGFAEMGPRNKPTLVTNWSQYLDRFGGFVEGYFLAHAVYGYFSNGGGTCYVVNLAPAKQALVSFAGDGANAALEVRAVRQGLATRSLSVEFIALPAMSSGPDTAPPSSDDPAAGTGDGPAKSKAPPRGPAAGSTKSTGMNANFRLDVKGERDGRIQVLESYETTLERDSPKFVETLVNSASQLVWLNVPTTNTAMSATPRNGSFALKQPPSSALQVNSNDFRGDVRDRSGVEGLEAIDEITIVCAPDLMSAFIAGKLGEGESALDTLKGIQQLILDHCANMQDRVAILDAPPGLDPQGVKEWRETKGGLDSAYGTLYYPWIKVLDPSDKTGKRIIEIPPSGHMAGIWARTDSTRGVHKAPANEVVRGVIDVAHDITHGEQGLLNPMGVNCIRSFGTSGIRVWGARTMASDMAWKYINVRRFFNYVEESIKQGTQWAVFEPNDYGLWQRLKRDISSFLLRPYRDGALFGATQDQAFYVKCDAETNPPDVIDAGMVIVEIGICPVKPAEFVIFRVTQLPTGGTAA